jgi:hypothetical protein
MLLVAAAGLGGAFVAAPSALAADWTIAPAAGKFGAGRPDLSYTLNPGGAVEDAIVIDNPGTSPLRVSVSVADAHTARSGQLELRGADGVGAFVRLARGDVTVAPGRSVTVGFKVALPAKAAPGDYAGGIVTTSGGQRVALPIRLRVGGALKPALAVEDIRVDSSAVRYTIRNTGNATLAARSRLKVSGPFGRFVAKADAIADTPALLPGERWAVSAPVHDVSAAAIRTTATVTVTPLLTDAAGSTAPLPAVKASGHAWTIPWALLAAVLFVVVLVTAAVRLRLRLRPRRRVHAT